MDFWEEKVEGESDRRRDDLNEKDEGTRGAVETPPLFYDDRKHSGLLDE